jgi:predicted nuclease of predicted toxin-antitoxin system
MNLLADENIPCQVVAHLRASGHQVSYIAEMSPSISDDEVLKQAYNTGEILLTSDKDFGELVYRLHQDFPGVILLRLPTLSNDQRAQLIAQVITKHEAEFKGAFTVITPTSIRIRHRSS